MNTLRLSVVGLCTVLVVGTASAQTKQQKCKLHCNPRLPAVYHPENDRKSGDILRGPRTVVAEDLNTLRYEYVFNTTTTFQKTPDVWATLTSMSLTLPSGAPAVTAQAGKTKAAAARVAAGAAQFPGPVQALLDRVVALQNEDAQRFATLDAHNGELTTSLDALAGLQQGANSAMSSVTLASGNLTSFLSNTSGIADELIPAINRELADPIFVAGLNATWPRFADVSGLQTNSTALKNALAAFKALFDPFVPKQTAALALLKQDCQTELNTLKQQRNPDQNSIAALNDALQDIAAEETALTDNATLLQWEVAQNDSIVTALPDLLPSSSKYGNFQQNQTILNYWKGRMTDTAAKYAAFHAGTSQVNPFERQTTSDCEFAFGGGKTSAVTLSRKDLLPGSDPKNSETVLSVSVQCTSPLSISAGVGFDTIGEKTFGIQAVANPAGSTTTTNTFVVKSQSSFHPVPIGMAHARLCELNNTVSFHFSLGVAAGIKSQDAGGSSAEFLIGPSLGLFRSVFLTPGLYIGQNASLSGYKVGDPVPSSITSPPLRTSYTTGFGFSITFTKP